MMRALLRDRGTVRLANVPRPTIQRDDDVLIRVLCVGICRTDIYVAEGRIPVREPRVLGHELCGVVDAVGTAVRSVAKGAAVAVMPLSACGACASCLRGEACIAPEMLGVDRDGAFAEWVVVPERCVYPSGGLPLRLAAYVEPMAASMAVLDVGLPKGGRGLVCGKNRVAELTRRVLELDGFEDIAVWDPATEPSPSAGAYDFAIETIASERVFSQLLHGLRVGGTLVLKSRPFAPVPLDVAAAVKRQVTIVAARYAEVAAAIEMLRVHGAVVDDLLGPMYALDDFDRAFASREEVKRFFRPSVDAERSWREASERA